MSDEQGVGIHPALPAADDQPAGDGLLIGGTFAIYAGPKGELILVTDVGGRGVERRVFPRRAVKFVEKLLRAGPLGAMMQEIDPK